MNRFAFALFALSLLIAGCKDVDIDPQPPTPQAEISIEINGLDTRSIDLTLSVRSADMKALDSWNFEKKPYRLKFDKKQSPLGAPVVPYMGRRGQRSRTRHRPQPHQHTPEYA